jgi:hypothetical protein
MRGEAISGPAKFWGEYIVQEVPSGTRVRKMGQIELDGLLQVAEVLGQPLPKGAGARPGKPETAARTAGSSTQDMIPMPQSSAR